jgi:hypothetical protein
MTDQTTAATESPDPLFRTWMAEIARYESASQKWEKRSAKIVKRFKDDRSGPKDEARTKYNILWSNLQVLLPAVYAKNPVPEVERRFKDDDPVGREASEVLERCIDFCIKTQPFKDIMRAAVQDRFLPGRGVVWVRYVPHIVASASDGAGGTLTDDIDAAPAKSELSGDPKAQPQESIEDEECLVDYVHWRDFGHTVARTWSEVRGVWRLAYLTRDECVKRFGKDIGNKIPLSATETKGQDKGGALDADLKKAVIYEIFDKVTRSAIWLCKEYPHGVLDEKDDPLGLSGFFPCARPLYATLDNESMIPTPDFVLYQDQADELDTLTARIASIVKAIKVAGVYNAAAQGVQRLLTEGVENELIPVDAWAAYAEKGGLKGAMEMLPIEEIASVLDHLYDARDRVKQDLYEITGLADILRGANDPTETATATRAKSAFASIRLRDMQDEVSRFVRDTLRIMGEVMARHFGTETLARISGVNLLSAAERQQMLLSFQPPPAMPGQPPAPPAQQPTPEQKMQLEKPVWEEVGQLLQDDAARNFRIDIETDSTIGEDEQQQKAERLEMLKAVAEFLKEAIPAIQQNPQMGPLLGQMLMFTLRSFKAGRTLENVFEATIKQLEDAAKQPPKPSAEETKANAAAQLVQAKGQTDIQVNRDRIQAETEQSERELAQQMKLEEFQARMDQQTAFAEQAAQQRQAAQEIALEQHRDQMKAAMEERARQMDAAQQERETQTQAMLQLILQHMKGAVAVEVAEIGADTTLEAAQVSAAKQGSGED